MRTRFSFYLLLLSSLLILLLTSFIPFKVDRKDAIKRYLYVATPGIRDYLGFGGHGILVFDMDNNHRFVKRIKTSGFHPDKTPSNVKGVAVSLPLNSIYVSSVLT